MSEKKLSEEEHKNLAISLRCKVSYIGKVVDKNRWDYHIYSDEKLSKEQERIITEKGLEILAGDGREFRRPKS